MPTTSYVASLILDGERPFGRRADNRTITLPVKIVAPNGSLQLLAAAREFLAADRRPGRVDDHLDPRSGARRDGDAADHRLFPGAADEGGVCAAG